MRNQCLLLKTFTAARHSPIQGEPSAATAVSAAARPCSSLVCDTHTQLCKLLLSLQQLLACGSHAVSKLCVSLLASSFARRLTAGCAQLLLIVRKEADVAIACLALATQSSPVPAQQARQLAAEMHLRRRRRRYTESTNTHCVVMRGLQYSECLLSRRTCAPDKCCARHFAQLAGCLTCQGAASTPTRCGRKSMSLHEGTPSAADDKSRQTSTHIIKPHRTAMPRLCKLCAANRPQHSHAGLSCMLAPDISSAGHNQMCCAAHSLSW
jgi:hypothetical protein